MIDDPILPRPPLALEDLLSFNKRTGRLLPIDMIVIHATEGSYESAVAWLRDNERPNPTSAHYVVSKAGRVARLVKEEDTAWHAGDSEWRGQRQVNSRSIGIELENKNDGKDPWPDVQLAVCLELCLEACLRHGVLVDDVVGHADVAPGRKTDPAGFPWERYRASLKRAVEGGSAA